MTTARRRPHPHTRDTVNEEPTQRNRIIEIEKQGSGLIAVRDGPSAKGFAVREANWESRLPNPIAPLEIKESVENRREARNNPHPVACYHQNLFYHGFKLLRCILAGASIRRREHIHTGTAVTGLACCVTGDCDPDNLPPLAPRKGRDFSGCDRLVSEPPVIAN
ncbi:hypothetical protein E3N88_13915 [Mikania micrantha]|uniref:Uncharacterized protein n=1 Tax=Mikania micrantha TaxID=192012 RepID=A0A5N6P310_9ASTR|nr:hypothetical protein E3N88_13915 [Mikania micrantha]